MRRCHVYVTLNTLLVRYKNIFCDELAYLWRFRASIGSPNARTHYFCNTYEYHMDNNQSIKQLKSYASKKCFLSFVDIYLPFTIARNIETHNTYTIPDEEKYKSRCCKKGFSFHMSMYIYLSQSLEIRKHKTNTPIRMKKLQIVSKDSTQTYLCDLLQVCPDCLLPYWQRRLL